MKSILPSRRPASSAPAARARPSPSPAGRPPRPRRRGLGLVEMLIALSITAALLTATGVALDTSFKAYRVNQELGDLTQRARLSMHRLTQEIRLTEDPSPDAALESLYRDDVLDPVTSASILLWTTPQKIAGTRYRLDTGRVLREQVRMVGGNLVVDSSTVFLAGVTNFVVVMEPQRSFEAARAGLPPNQLRRATVRLTLSGASSATTRSETTGQQAVTLVASVVPRRNAW